ncbi:NACHT domain-containing protein [Moraxella sp. K2450]|uniref:NACHT domain-containing protein n=1 Tax=Moraxella sp. K2450 TaxID=2780076 RepID=UPI00187F1632|nr:NACHT domain-containing protein [Moraxella sp. K2450]MBE9595968.1 NACHT domain-containing protein [Moraxella sp. K2450]
MSFNPSYLFTPNSSEITPPIETNANLLPIEQLRWEDFEKLCLRLAQAIHGKNNCEIYGVAGQKQDGIDIFAYKNSKYSSYQCKRYKAVSKNDLKTAVETFRSGKWHQESNEFIFCTTFELNKTQLQDKFNELREGLKSEGIDFIKWDKIQISAILKDYPQIVYDFFGKAWVKAFNGEEAFKNITERRKLDSLQVIEYRKKLLNVYSATFQANDIGIPASHFDNYLAKIQDRFILPDFIEKQIIDNHQQVQDEKQQEFRPDFLDGEEIYSYQDTQQLRKNKYNHSVIFRENEVRLNPDNCLSKNNKVMILGEPGSGKSTLLRYLVLDLLSDEPKLINTTKEWGDLLPVWLPFAFITKKLHENENLNLSEILLLWLKSIGQELLFELINDALQDERLLLVIDGIDEWTNSGLAKIAISRIDIQTSLNNTKVIYSSRPYGYRLQKEEFYGIKTYTIGEFSVKQQEKFISYWYEQWMECKGLTEINFVKNSTQQFLLELEQSADLLRLSTNPLLLSILISHRFGQITLPRNKVKLLDNITEHLIEKHPIKRRTSANISDESEYEFNLFDIFSVLAKDIHENHHDGIILKEDACTIIGKYLIEELDYENAKAKKVSKNILDIGANNIGIIIEKSPDEVAFLHRQFQEFMTAKYLINSDEDIIQNTLENYGENPQWSQVIYFFFGLIPDRNRKKFINCINIIGNESKVNHYTKFLKYTLALILNNAPIDKSQIDLNNLISEFEYETHPKRKEVLWNILLKSLYNPKINEKVLDYLFKYFPNIYAYNDKRLEALMYLSKENLTDTIRHFIVTSLINGNIYQKLQASKVIQKFIDDEWIFEKINHILSECYNPEIIAYLINTLISEKVESSFQTEIFAKYVLSEHPKIYLFATKLKVYLNMQTNQDLDGLVNKIEGISYTLDDEIEQLFIDGWGNSNELFKYLMNNLNMHVSDAKIKHEMIWSILFKCYNSKDEVVDKVINVLKSQDYRFLHLHGVQVWQKFSEGFRGNKKLIPVIEEWLQKDDNKHRDIETAYACLIGRTENNKEYLFEQLLDKSGFPHWQLRALTSGWSDDRIVINRLKDYFRSDNNRKGFASGYISKVFSDEPKEGIKIAEEIFFNKDMKARNRALSPLIELDKNYFEINLLDRFLEQELPLLDKNWGDFYESIYLLIQYFPENQRVKSLAIQELAHSPAAVVQFLPELMNEFEQSLTTSLPMEESFRVHLVQELQHKYFSGNTKVIEQLSHFLDEKDSVIQMASAIAYFEHMKDKNPDVVLERSNELVFAVGDCYESQRQIAFIGYLKINQLNEYFLLENPEKYYADKSREERLANPYFRLFDSYRTNGNLANQILVDNFDVIYKATNGDLSKISQFGKDEFSQENWGFIAKISNKDSPTVPYIMDYMNNLETIHDGNLMNFLIKNTTDKNQLKKILIEYVDSKNSAIAITCGKLLGDLFSDDKDIYHLVSNIEDVYQHEGRLMALCQGWANDKKLLDIFDELVKNQPRLSESLAFNLIMICGKPENILDFLADVLGNYHEFDYYHRFLYTPLIKRLKNDDELRRLIKTTLLNTQSISEKISFYALLDEIGAIDQEIIDWKNAMISNVDLNQFGYDITKNKLVSLDEVLIDLNYESLTCI